MNFQKHEYEMTLQLVKDLDERMQPILQNILDQSRMYQILQDEKRIQVKRLEKLKNEQLNKLIPKRDDEE